MTDRQEPQGKDRRIFKRIYASFGLMFNVRSPFEVRVQFGEKDVDAIAVDIGEGGIGMLTNGVIPIGTRVELKFKIFNDSVHELEGSYRSFELQGDVRYSVVTKESDYRLGVQFGSVTEEERKFLIDYVRANNLRPTESE